MRNLRQIWIVLNGHRIAVAKGSTVGAAMMNVGAVQRTSVKGEPRAALCGMGVCFECRAVVDGVIHRRTCQLPCRQDMVVETHQ